MRLAAARNLLCLSLVILGAVPSSGSAIAGSGSSPALAAGLAVPSSAPPRTEGFDAVVDRVGDGLFAQGDLEVVAADAPSTGLVALVAGVEEFASPTGADWSTGESGPLWQIDNDVDGRADYSVWMRTEAGEVVATVVRLAPFTFPSLFPPLGTVVCDASTFWDPVDRFYTAVFPATCIQNPERFSFRVVFAYRSVGLGASSDTSPDTGWAGPVRNDAFDIGVPGPSATGAFRSIVPARVYETRPGLPTVDGSSSGMGLLGPGWVTMVIVGGRAGVPAHASAVVLNVTAIDARSAGHLTVFPCGSTQPNASNLNFVAGQTVANAVISKVGVIRSVCIYSPSALDLAVDVTGYFTDGPVYRPLEPSRLLETRSGLSTVDGSFNGIGARQAGSTLELQVTGRAGVPADAAAVVMNVTAVGGAAAGHLTVFPCGTPTPNASSLNFAAGQTVANLVVARIGAGGRVCLFTSSTVDLVVDINGYFGATSPFASVVPARLLDTRAGLSTVDGTFEAIGARAAGSVTELVVAGRGGVPADASTVVLNVTVTEPTAAGFVTVFPCGAERPNASNLNHVAGQSVPNAVVSKVGDGGRVCIFTMTRTELIVDVNGYFPSR